MSVIVFLIIVGVLVAGGFLAGFIWSVRTGQYDDLYSPSVRVLFDDPPDDPDGKIEEHGKTEDKGAVSEKQIHLQQTNL